MDMLSGAVLNDEIFMKRHTRIKWATKNKSVSAPVCASMWERMNEAMFSFSKKKK